LLILATALAVLASPVWSKEVAIKGKYSRAQIASACDKVGGVKSNTSGKSGSYGCDNLDKGTSVHCDANGKCKGWVPMVAPPGNSLHGVLGGQVAQPARTPPTPARGLLESGPGLSPAGPAQMGTPAPAPPPVKIY
jgi:hypothetical protein